MSGLNFATNIFPAFPNSIYFSVWTLRSNFRDLIFLINNKDILKFIFISQTKYFLDIIVNQLNLKFQFPWKIPCGMQYWFFQVISNTLQL